MVRKTCEKVEYRHVLAFFVGAIGFDLHVKLGDNAFFVRILRVFDVNFVVFASFEIQILTQRGNCLDST